MPTQSTTYNTRLTDETLEKRFRDTFRSQGGAELVDDLYASGVIVPIVDFTAAAEGSALRADLQTAWDFTTGSNTIENGGADLISNSGFWQVDLNFTSETTPTPGRVGRLFIDDGSTTKTVWRIQVSASNDTGFQVVQQDKFVVFLRPGDILKATSSTAETRIDVWYRQIADLSGNLVQPSGFTSS